MIAGPLFVGNWKMNMLPDEAVHYCRDFLAEFEAVAVPDCAIAAPAVLLPVLQKELAGKEGVMLAAQNVHWEDSGAHTGEISAPMLKAVGVELVLVGHSERRALYGENDANVAKRALAAVEHGLHVVGCGGESKEEYEAGKSAEITAREISDSIATLGSEHVANLTIAYEPVWAIGTGLAATAEHAAEMHTVIRGELCRHFGEDYGHRVRIIYGGSTTPENISELISADNVQGALPGGSSLKPQVFNALIVNGRKAYAAK